MKPTQEQAIAWAKKASGVEFPAGVSGMKIGMSPEHLERFAALAYEAGRKDENEAIADAVSKCDPRATPKGIAAAIRARREQ